MKQTTLEDQERIMIALRQERNLRAQGDMQKRGKFRQDFLKDG